MQSQSEKACIYALCAEDGKVRYIGQTCDPDSRFRAHSNQKHWAFGLYILEWVEVARWAEREKFWIAHYRSIGRELMNGTTGGQGSTGHKQSANARALKGLANSRRVWSEESRRRASVAKRGRPLGRPSEEHRRRISEAKRGWNPSEETRRRMSEAKRGKAPSFLRNPQTRANAYAKASASLKATLKAKRHGGLNL